MKEYLSHGMGVNSTALMLLLLDEGRDFESVFVDHQGDYPETYEYLEYLQDKGYEITALKPSVSWKGKWSNIYDYFHFHKSIPLMRWRVCTWKFKINTFNKHIETPCKVYLGFDSEEKSRVWKRRGRVKNKVTEEYPLIERGISRKGCKRIIKEHGLNVPRKSGCFFCPFQKLSEWKKLLAEPRTIHKSR